MIRIQIFAAASPFQVFKDFGVNWQLFLTQLVVFLILLWLLKRYAFGPVMALLEERRRRVVEGLDNAAKAEERLASTEKERKEILEQANQEAGRLIEEAREVAARVQERESRKAVAQAEQIVAQAREAAAADHARMLAELKGEVGRLVVRTTGQVLGKVLGPEDQQRLQAETADRLRAS